MARILIGWELGGGRGHLVALLALSQLFNAQGHETAIAVQSHQALPPDLPDGIPIYQAPLWPGLLKNFEDGPWRRAATLIDILARLGLDRPRTLKHMLGSWDAIFSSFKPDLVIGDFAPALLLAAQGRIPSIATGPGFQIPPYDADPLPRVAGGEPGYDEVELLDIIDADLRECGRPRLDTLGSFFACSRQVIATFVELDPYRRAPGTDFAAPMLDRWAAPQAIQGDEIFVYAYGPMQRIEGLWQALAATGHRVRAHLLIMDEAVRALTAKHGIIVEREPVPLALIAAQSRIAVHYGAHGLMSALILAGIPQFVLPMDLEKQLNAQAMASLGVGLFRDPNVIKPAELTAELLTLYNDPNYAAIARQRAPEFAQRMSKPYEESMTEAVHALI